MTNRVEEARIALQKARQALRNNARTEARQYAEQAAKLAPQLEDPWLLLAAVASPRASLEYVQRALKINPESPRARRGMQWAMQRLQQPEELGQTSKTPAAKPTTARAASPATPPARPASRPGAARRPLVSIMLLGVGCLVCAAAAWSAIRMPAVAAVLGQNPVASEATRPPSWAQASIPKPTYTPESPLSPALAQAATATPEVALIPAATEQPGEPTLSTDLSTELPTDQPTQLAAEVPTEGPTDVPTVEPTWSGSLTMQYVQDTPTSAVAPTKVPAATAAPAAPGTVAGDGVHWIDVNLTQQMVYAYSGNTVVNSFLVSTGTWMHPTVTGKYHVYVKLRYTDMTGADYYLPNVPYTMYFYEGYGLHGTYWHHNFGTPMSHGCVNLSIPDAAWLYDFSSVGTLVNVHY
jgi:lipoprotein-anchoring transpeptidase ErfK/SrfK